MKHTFKLLAFTALLPVAVFAQSSLDEEVNAELDRMYQSQAAPSPQAQKAQSPAVQVNVQAQPQVAATQYQGGQTTAVAQQPTMVQQPTMAQQAQPQQVQANPVLMLQKQPTTYIEATPLVESNAEKLRKSRQDAELQTEQKIVEKLETSRLEDEKKRAEVLFGDKFNTLMNQNQAPAAPAPAPVPVAQPVPIVVPEQVVAPAPAVVKVEELPKEEKLDREAVRSEVSAALAEFKTTQQKEKPATKSYLAVMAGSGDYPDAKNVKGQYSLGIAYGRKFNDRLVAEASFNYANYQVEQPAGYGNGAQVYNYQTGQYDYYPRITDMNQYGTSGMLKYQLLGGIFRPEIGTLMTYTYRTFTDKQFALSDSTVSSQALDLGLMLGAAIELSDNFELGLDYRYMWNMTNKVDGTTIQKSSLYGQSSGYTPIEEMNYYNISVVGRATF